jgi:cytoskeletal protein RodZ
MRKLGLASTVALFAAFAVTTSSFAQSQNDSSQSVAEAARKAKERKKASPKDNRVITNDTINLLPASADASGAPSAGTVVTTTPPTTPSDTAATTTSTSAPAASANVSATAKSAATGGSAADAKKKEEAAAAAAKTKELLAQAQVQLDLFKRELALDSDSFFSKPDYAHDTAGKAKLDELKQSIGDKQISVEELKQQLTELMEKAGISLDDEKPATPPQH